MVIAIVASNVALVVFFILRKQWEDSPIRIMFCAILLSGAVTSMHYTAALGTIYYVVPDNADVGGTSSTPVTIFVVIVVRKAPNMHRETHSIVHCSMQCATGAYSF